METLITAFTYFIFVLTGAIIGGAATRRMSQTVIDPLLAEVRYMIKHLSAHDLQVYHGIQEVDWGTNRPYDRKKPKSMEQQIMDADALARELDRQYGDLPPNAE